MTEQCAYDPSCPDPIWRGGICKYHYSRRQYLKRIGKTEEETNSWRQGETLEEKLWREVVKGEGDECWIWTGMVMDQGYGQVWHEGTHLYVHRVSYELANGPIEDGLDADHECHNEAAERGECAGGADCPHHRCVRPDHLVPKTRGDNVKASPLWRKSTGWKDPSSDIADIKPSYPQGEMID